MDKHEVEVYEAEVTPIPDFASWVMKNYDFAPEPVRKSKRARFREPLGFRERDDFLGHQILMEYFSGRTDET